MHAGGVHLDRRRLIGAKQSEANEEYVKYRRVVGVLDVLEHQLPVGGNALPHVAEHTEVAAVEDTVEIRKHPRAEVVLERTNPHIECRKDDAVTLGDGKPSHPMLSR